MSDGMTELAYGVFARSRSLVLGLAFLFAGCAAERNLEPVQGLFVFEGARLITGDGSAPIEHGALVVRDGIIESLGDSNTIKRPAGASVIDLSGKTVMPMIVNVHGHVGYMKGAATGAEHFSRENVLDHLRRYAYYGVGVIQSLGLDRDGVEIAIRDEQRRGTLVDPDLALLLSAANGIVVPTPGSVNGGPFFATDVVHEASDAAEARTYVRSMAVAQPDIIKIWVDDRNGTKAKMPPEIYRAIIAEAHAQGFRVVAHVYYLDDAKDLVRSGVDGLAHMVRAEPGVDEELVQLIKENDVFACATLSVQKRMVDGPTWLDDPVLAETVRPEAIAEWKVRIESAPPEAIERAKVNYARLQESLRKLSEGGARIVLCGDTGFATQAPGFTDHRELEAMAQAGMSPLEAIHAATRAGAEVVGLDDRGALAPGMRADFIVLNANPLERVANTRGIVAVYRGGVAIDRDALSAKWTASEP